MLSYWGNQRPLLGVLFCQNAKVDLRTDLPHPQLAALELLSTLLWDFVVIRKEVGEKCLPRVVDLICEWAGCLIGVRTAKLSMI